MDKTSLIRRNIEACEQARKWRCTCPCAGQYHRQKHPAEWVAQVIAEANNPKEEAQNELNLG